MRNYPFCSIVVLNYYGEKVIGETLNSLLNLNYPKKQYEIIVVDNNSKDKSDEILKRYTSLYKSVKVIFLDKNLGFSKGNNIGIKKAKGDYVCLVNNDCIVGKNWLKELIIAAISSKEIFAVNPKILLYPKFIRVKFHLIQDLVPVYAMLSKSNLHTDSKNKLTHLSLWRKPTNTTFKYEYYIIEIPYDPNRDRTVEVTILFNSRELNIDDKFNLQNFIFFTNSSIKVAGIIKNEDDIECRISLDVTAPQIKKDSQDKIQNAGIFVFQDGYGRDIGSIVRYSQQYFEFDQRQYNERREVYAACGAAVLYNKKILKKIGYFDENFFMYYEDLEISERARLLGYKIIYEPKAVVRHYHALSSKEWSPFFIYHVEKGRLLHVLYNFPLRIFIREYLYMSWKSFVTFLSILVRLRILFYTFRKRKTDREESMLVKKIQVVRALIFFILNSPFLMLRRLGYMRKRNNKAVEANYMKILKGEWYFI